MMAASMGPKGASGGVDDRHAHISRMPSSAFLPYTHTDKITMQCQELHFQHNVRIRTSGLCVCVCVRVFVCVCVCV